MNVPSRLVQACTAVVCALLCAAAGAVPPSTNAAPLRAGDPELERIIEEAREAAAVARDRAADARRIAQGARDEAAVALAFAEVDVDALMLEPSLAFVAGEFGNVREIVKNAPYQAEAINESIQVLPDGNRIVKRRTTLLARDGYGRTRQERKGDHGGSVYIFDPIDNKSYALSVDRKVAVRIPRAPAAPWPSLLPEAPPPLAVPAPPPLPAPPAPPALPAPPDVAPGAPHVDVKPGRVVVRHGATRDGEDVRIEVIRVGGEGAGVIAPSAPLPPLTLPMLPRGKGDTKNLGSREFDGVKADGTQTTYTIAAGEIGNEKPIVVTSERWFSPEYNVVVYAKQSDPRIGDTIYRLANFRRGEPPPELFKVPADYRTKPERR